MDGSGISEIEESFEDAGKIIAGQDFKLEEPKVAFFGSLDPAQYLANTDKSKIVLFDYTFIHEKNSSDENGTPPLVLSFLIDIETNLRRSRFGKEYSGTGRKIATVLVELATENPLREGEPLRAEKLFLGEARKVDRTGIFCVTPNGEKLRMEHSDLADGVAREIFKGSADNVTDSVDLAPMPPEDPRGFDEFDNPQDPNEPHIAWHKKIAIVSVDVSTRTINGHLPPFSYNEQITAHRHITEPMPTEPLGLLADPKHLIEARM